MADEKKIGVYIYSGDEIGEAVDCNLLTEKIKEDSSIIVCKVMKNLCTKKGADEIRKDIAGEGLDAIVIGASSPRYHCDIFDFENIIMERVNLREGVAWTHEHKDQHTFDLALDYMKMGIEKAKMVGIPEPMILDINETVMVVGGGVTGMNSAIAAAKAGYSVVLAEKAPELGGFYRKLYKLTPRKAPYYSLEPNTCEALIAEVESMPKIKVFTNCIIEETSGQPGMFDVKAKVNGEDIGFQVGTIVQATGWQPYDANKLGHLGYGKFKNVVTNIEIEELANNGGIKRKSDGGDIKSITFIQCAGSRDPEHLPYCSNVCCMSSLKQAMYVREKYPNAAVYIIYKDVRTPGNYEKFYKRVQNEDSIFLTKGEIVNMSENEDGTITLDVDNTLLDEKISIKSDMVVLATGLVPSSGPERVQAAAKEEEKKEGDVVKEEVSVAKILDIPKEPVLNLKYIQGPELPTLHYGFPDSHYICFPYETRRTGIYAAGAVRAPMDIATAKNDAYGAALKAIQCIENIRKGTAVHPRSGDKTYPDFFFQRCTQCKRCTEECPFGALQEDVKGTPQPNPNRCRRCGICMGACPERIISFKNYSVQIISGMIKSIYIPTEEEDGVATPRIIAFMCENDAYPSLDIVARKRIQISPYFRIIPVRCLGSVSTSWIADSLSQGFDGALLIGCKYGEDYQCHFIKGSELANTRMENVQEKLKQLVLEPERVELHMLSLDEYDKLPEIMNKFAKTIEDIGPNPYKEM
ncbi:MAG: hydrogenase iron-sulfur subunit [bacterium]